MLQALRVRSYIKAMVKLGLNEVDVLANTGLTTKTLSHSSTVINKPQAEVLIENMITLTGDEAIGLKLGESIDIGEMGLLGHAMVAAPTFRHTVELWQAYASTLFGTHAEISVESGDAQSPWLLYLTSDLDQELHYRFCIEEYLALANEMAQFMTKAPLVYHELSLVYPPPKHYLLYESLFDCPVNFSASSTYLAVRSPQLDDIVETRDDYLYRLHKQYCQRQSLARRDASQASFLVHNYFLRSLGRAPAIEEAADEIGLSVRTLKRRLQAEGTSFRLLLNSFREDFARENLVTGALRAKEIGYLLGYRDNKAFLRAFKGWTGITTREYRQAILRDRALEESDPTCH